MDEAAAAILTVLCVIGVFLAGYILGIAAFVRTRSAKRRLDLLEQRFDEFRKEVMRGGLRPGTPEAPRPIEPAPEKEETPSRETPPPPLPVEERTPPETLPWPVVKSEIPPALRAATGSVPKPKRDKTSFEVKLGTRWIIWLGATMFLGGVGLALKYSYDNDLIGPVGRLAVGVLAGMAAVVAGERFRHKGWSIPFQAFTGAGFATFYICIYFAFQVYEVAGVGPCMAAAMLVTGLAVTLAVAHNALSIAVLAVLGGYASPIMMSTGENHPYVFFTYIAVLNLVALGSAWFRRWRVLDLVCFLGTAFLYQGWFMKFYEQPTTVPPAELPSQLIPALLYITIFYLMFLTAPTLYSLVRKMPEQADTLALVVLNALFSLYCYYNVLFIPYRFALGFVVLAQALMVFLLFRAWVIRVDKASQTAESLLIIALALTTLAIPLQLKLYGIPIAWAVEGALFVYLGLRAGKFTVRLGGCAALVLSAGGLLHRLPLHTAPFNPVFNRAFGAWLAVIAAAAVASWIVYHKAREDDPFRLPMAIGAALLALILACTLLTLEVGLYWEVRRVRFWFAHQSSCLALLWTAIPLLFCAVVRWKKQNKLIPLPWAAFAVGVLVFLYGLDSFSLDSSVLALNSVFLSKAVFIVGLWTGARLLSAQRESWINAAFELIGHAVLAVTAVLELGRWSHHTDLLSDKMAFGIVSAVWAVQACVLIWYGLLTRRRFRRYAGFLLFGLAALKTIVIDSFALAEVYRIVSWLASGILLVTAALLYQRYSAMLLGEEKTEDES